jgi:hypothetical protein
MASISTLQEVTLERVVFEWTKRLEKYTNVQGEYVGRDEEELKRWKCFHR